MGLLSSLVKTGLNIVITPVEIVKDVATLGGTLTNKDKPYTVEHVEEIIENIEEVVDEDEI